MESIARLAAQRPIGVIVLALLMVLLGGISWRELPLDLFPDVRSPTILVSVNAGDRPPLEMERLYAERVEQRLFTVQGLRSIDQVARTGRLVARVTFGWDVNVDYALVDVSKALAPLNADPEVDEVVVRRVDPRELPIVTLGMVAPAGQPDLAELRRVAERQVAPALQQLDGVAEVRVTGGREPQVQVQLDRGRMQSYGITLTDIENRIRSANVDRGAGTLEEDNQVYLIRGISRLASAQEISDLVIRYVDVGDGAKSAIRIADVGKVITGNADITHLVKVDGREGVGLAIYKEADANTVAVARTVREAMTALRADLPGVEVRLVTDESVAVQEAIGEVEWGTLIGIVLAVAVLAAFLRHVGSILVVAAAVPVSLLATVFAMRVADQSLNLMTLGGLALAAGMLVDNAIVVIESVYRRRAAGDTAHDAAVKGTGMVAGAIVSSTLATCVVFLPVLFVNGMAARLVAGMAFTVVLALLVSLAVAVLLIPALARWLLPTQPAEGVDPGAKYTEAMLSKLLQRPLTVIAVCALLSLASIVALVRLGTELVPPADPSQFALRVTAAPGLKVEATAEVVGSIESILRSASSEAVAATLAEVGRLPDDGRVIREKRTEENMAELRVRLNEGDITAGSLAQRVEPAFAALHGVEISWGTNSSALASLLGLSGPPIVVEVDGKSLEDLRRSAEILQAELARRPELWDVRTSFEGSPPEYRLRLSRTRADALGVDAEAISRVLEAALDGRKVGTLALGDEEQDVVLQVPYRAPGQLLALTFQTPAGQLLSIGDVARLETVSGAQEIFRRNQRRVIQVTAQIQPEFDSPRARAAVAKTLAAVALPPGLTARLAGDEAERVQTVSQLQWAGILAVLLVLMVLAASFESLLHPFTVLAAIPVSLVGVALLLVPVGQPIGIMAMLGLVVLVGIAVNDAILLVDRAKQLQASGMELQLALVRAASQRLRPILMNTAINVVALVPLAIGAGESAQLRSPLALTVIGGLAASLVGSLTVVPCIYLVFEQWRERMAQLALSLRWRRA